MTRLYCKLVADALNEWAYDATVAGLAFGLINTAEGIQLTVRGYNEKQNLLLQKIAERMAAKTFPQDRFEAIKEAVRPSSLFGPTHLGTP